MTVVRRLAQQFPISTGQVGFGPRSFEVSFVAQRPVHSEALPCASVGEETKVASLPAAKMRAREQRIRKRMTRVEAWAAPSIQAEDRRVARRSAMSTPIAAPYFEAQVGAWSGMHVLNNFLGSPYVMQPACERAAA